MGTSHYDSADIAINEVARGKREHRSTDADQRFLRTDPDCAQGNVQLPNSVLSLHNQSCFKGRGKCDGKHGGRRDFFVMELERSECAPAPFYQLVGRRNKRKSRCSSGRKREKRWPGRHVQGRE